MKIMTVLARKVNAAILALEIVGSSTQVSVSNFLLRHN
jgi:hypothetical protein